MADQKRTNLGTTDLSSTTLNAEVIQHSMVSWRAIFAGALVSILVYMILLSLGLAFGGANLQGVIQGQDSAQGLGIGAGIWMIVSTLLSIFAGSYAAGRVSGMISTRVGRIQGLVVAALFFLMLFSQVGSAVGLLGRGLGSMVGMVGGVAGDAAGSSQVQQIVGDAVGDLNLRSSPETVVSGVASRMIRGDDQGAMAYLSRQSGITQQEASTRLNGIKAQVTQAATEAGTTAARAMKTAGWTLFGATVLGSLVALLGGALGAQWTLRAPISEQDRKALRHSRPATV